MFSFHCPHCSTPLRFRDLSYRGRTVPCPECQQNILIEEQHGELVGRAVKSATSASPPSASRKFSPRVFAIGFAVAATAVVGWFAWPPAESNVVEVPSVLPAPVVNPPDPPQPEVPRRDEQPVDVLLAQDDVVPQPVDPLTEMPAQAEQPQVPAAPNPTPAGDPLDPPIEVLLAADGPSFDIQDRLGQRLLTFHPLRPMSLEELAFEMQELLGAPVDVSRLSETGRRQLLNIDLKDTTLATLVQTVARESGTEFEVRPEKIIFQPVSTD